MPCPTHPYANILITVNMKSASVLNGNFFLYHHRTEIDQYGLFSISCFSGSIKMCQWVINPVPLYCSVNGICWLNPRSHPHIINIFRILIYPICVLTGVTTSEYKCDRQGKSCRFIFIRGDVTTTRVMWYKIHCVTASTCFTIYHKHIHCSSLNSITCMPMVRLTPSWNYLIGLQDYFWIHAGVRD